MTVRPLPSFARPLQVPFPDGLHPLQTSLTVSRPTLRRRRRPRPREVRPTSFPSGSCVPEPEVHNSLPSPAETVLLKRLPALPREARTISTHNNIPQTLAPIPYGQSSPPPLPPSFAPHPLKPCLPQTRHHHLIGGFRAGFGLGGLCFVGSGRRRDGETRSFQLQLGRLGVRRDEARVLGVLLCTKSKCEDLPSLPFGGRVGGAVEVS